MIDSGRGRSWRVVIAPDSFKGSASATEVAATLARGWHSRRPQDEIVTLPIADGGEGTLDVFAATVPGASRRPLRVTGPDGRGHDGEWLALPGGCRGGRARRGERTTADAYPGPVGRPDHRRRAGARGGAARGGQADPGHAGGVGIHRRRHRGAERAGCRVHRCRRWGAAARRGRSGHAASDRSRPPGPPARRGSALPRRRRRPPCWGMPVPRPSSARRRGRPPPTWTGWPRG